MISKKCWHIPPSASWDSWWRGSAWVPLRRVCSTLSRMPSSRHCSSYLPVPCCSAWSADIITFLIMERKRNRGTRASPSSAHPARPEESAGTGEVFDPGDMRNMGGLRKTMPVTFWVYVIGALALAGIFPFAGFWSKDEILAAAFSQGYTAVYWLLTIAAFFTAFYMGRQIWMVFFGEPHHEAAAKAEESPKVITVPLMILAALSVLGGAFNLPRRIGRRRPGRKTFSMARADHFHPAG